ncbi:ribosomal protein subunit L7 [Schizosaccharomyces octosporus yFS286]|uniref:Ribosomal protein subunit L7 n=1 Tax=Schizosaccharomyces octosporus (strain yFS286) TaxID=483514 RepID=S9Q1G4_SCHOY|nr:ribosomal protein subunit L7 [Schizosaccharomyces octosporus yFS286]EPX73992.1 ribosomal protein subunit L7 [Schizosaccharomyces octosporus yFS286]
MSTFHLKTRQVLYSIVQRRAFTTKQKLGKNSPLPGWDPHSEYFHPGPTMAHRLEEHMNDTVMSDVLVGTYKHNVDFVDSSPHFHEPADRLVRWKGDNPYYKNRPPRHFRGYKPLLPYKRPVRPENLPNISKVVVSTMVKEALQDKSHLLSTIMAFRSITGVEPEIIKARKDVSPWRLRSGFPVGASVTLEGEPMYNFLSVLSELVLPQLHDFKGISSTVGDQTGNISFGLPGNALPLFPQIEAVYEMYPHSLPGFHVNVVTNAQDTRLARFALSSLIPFKTRNPEDDVQ